MRTHENADPSNAHAQVDFCWDAKYIQMNSCYSDVYNNETQMQAWRAGFREGVKLATDQGLRLTPDTLKNNHWRCLHWLYIWTMIGADIKNGLWAIYGAREGLYMSMCTDWDYLQVRDFKYLNEYWDKTVSVHIHDGNLLESIQRLGTSLIDELDIPISVNPLDAQQSKFFKAVYEHPARTNNLRFIDKE